MKTRRIAGSDEKRFQKIGESMRETCKQILKSTRRMSSTNDCRSFKHSEIQ